MTNVRPFSSFSIVSNLLYANIQNILTFQKTYACNIFCYILDIWEGLDGELTLCISFLD
jgi:hypothetical protein